MYEIRVGAIRYVPVPQHYRTGFSNASNLSKMSCNLPSISVMTCTKTVMSIASSCASAVHVVKQLMCIQFQCCPSC